MEFLKWNFFLKIEDVLKLKIIYNVPYSSKDSKFNDRAKKPIPQLMYKIPLCYPDKVSVRISRSLSGTCSFLYCEQTNEVINVVLASLNDIQP